MVSDCAPTAPAELYAHVYKLPGIRRLGYVDLPDCHTTRQGLELLDYLHVTCYHHRSEPLIKSPYTVPYLASAALISLVHSQHQPEWARPISLLEPSVGVTSPAPLFETILPPIQTMSPRQQLELGRGMASTKLLPLVRDNT